MTAHLRKLASDLSETFWLIPGVIVVVGVIGAFVLVKVDHSGGVLIGYSRAGYMMAAPPGRAPYWALWHRQHDQV